MTALLTLAERLEKACAAVCWECREHRLYIKGAWDAVGRHEWHNGKHFCRSECHAESLRALAASAQDET